MMDWYMWASNMMASARSKRDGKPLCAHTRLYEEGDDFLLTYHNTDILRYRPDRTIVIDTNGWASQAKRGIGGSTTRQRINDYSPAHLFMCRGTVFIHTAGPSIPFVDGMVVEGLYPRFSKPVLAAELFDAGWTTMHYPRQHKDAAVARHALIDLYFENGLDLKKGGYIGRFD
jgi:hypothetical protein